MTLESLIQTLGLPGLAIGASLEGETVAFLAGVLAHRGLFAFEAAALAVTLGATVGDNITFLIGRQARDSAFVQKNMQRRAVKWLHDLFDRNRVLAILCFRFLYGMKTAGCVMMSATQMPWRQFALWDLIAVLIWAHVIVGLGYAAGTAVKAVFGELHLHWHLLLSFVLFALGGIAVWWLTRRLWRSPKGGGLPPGSAG